MRDAELMRLLTCPERSRVGRSLTRGTAPEQRAELGLQSGIGCIEHFAPGHDDHVDPAGRLVMTKQLANQPFRAVSLYCRPHFPGGGNAKTRCVGLPVPGER